MKKPILTVACIVLLIAASLMTGCVEPIIEKEPGPTTTREYNFTDFTSIEIGHAFKMEVTPADTYSISISASEDIFDYIDVSKTGNKLQIDMDNVIFRSYRSPRVKITMPELRGLYISGASEGNVKGFKSSQDMDCTISGASDLDLDIETGNFECEISGASEVSGYLKATSCDISLSGASKIELDGSGGNIKIEASGASQADLGYFPVNDADINFSGASDGTLDINGRLDVKLSGLSTLEFSGNPTLGDLDISGESELERR